VIRRAVGYDDGMKPPVSPGAAPALLREIEALAARRAFAEAEAKALQFTGSYPERAEGWQLLGRLRQQRSDLAGALEATREGLEVAPADKGLRLLGAELSLQSGSIGEGLARLRALEPDARNDGRVLQHIAQLFTKLNLHHEAEGCYRRAVETAPSDPQYLYNLATSVIALGKMEEAEALLDKVIAQSPCDYDAYYNRATLRRQTATRNHVAQIEQLLSRPLHNPMGEVQLCYGLAKELEDLGEHRRSFAALKRGADARRKMLSYRVDDDIRAMSEIASVFSEETPAGEQPGEPNARPIFIVGLPRSGTTLVDRILSSHSQVESLGEISDFASALMRAAPAATDKFDLIRRTASIDFAAVGKAYCESTAAVATGMAHSIDKTPINFLYLGLIARALPNAAVIHVRRGAMDVCYAMYKTLFRMAYPFSYDLGDLAHYYLGYRALMAHWRKALPGRFLEIDYEDLVANQQDVTHRLVAHCNLDWEESCLEFEKNERPSLTASAAQVRQKIYGSSVGLWRAYSGELEPLARILGEAGVNVESE
jgi:tetratricopeptide (TPR) repeat protein